MMNILLIAFLVFVKNIFQIVICLFWSIRYLHSSFNSLLMICFLWVQRTINVTYDSTTNNVEGSLVASGDLWRVEASHGSSTSTSGNENSSLFLVQLGLLFVRDSRLLLPVHLSKQHLLWYGYDRKVGTANNLVWTICAISVARNK